MKISVYGATGFIGSVFCNLYPDETLEIPREDRKPQSDEILYLISTTSNYNVLEDLAVDVDVNLRILMEVLAECKNNNLVFNFVSSGFVYGNDIIDAKETDYCEPKGFYSITKRAAEMLLISFCETFDVRYRIFRIANVYGTEDSESSGKKNALGFLISLLKENRDIDLYDGGDVLRDYLHVSDVCRAMHLVMEKGDVNTIYNLASGKPVKFYDIIDMARTRLESNSKINSIEAPKFYQQVQAKNFSLNVDRLKALGFEEKITLQEGVNLLCH